jgi:hypothetical protein
MAPGDLIGHNSHPGLNPKDTVAPMNLDGDAFLLSSFYNLVLPTDIIALLFAGELHRLAIPQASDDRFPIDISIFVLNL